MAPLKVDKLTFEVAKLITLERPKSGQTDNSPAFVSLFLLLNTKFQRAFSLA